jgi:hypothetical protein
MVARRGDLGLTRLFSGRGSLCRCATASKWNVEGGLHCIVLDGFLFSSFPPFCVVTSLLALTDGWVDGFGRCSGVIVGMRVSSIHGLGSLQRLLMLCPELWNMLQESKPNRLLLSSATRT